MAIGVNEEALATVFIDVQADAHFIYLADVERGKTNFLKVLAAGVMDRYTAAEVRLLVVDYRRTMLGFVPKDYLAGYAPGLRRSRHTWAISCRCCRVGSRHRT